nr:hypothetical protein Iba_chr02bCG22320 [Ipomoea batatas]GMC65590.1 hypothetical protein Iba_chr02dCG15550 [Ipomoea batatas]
MLSTIRNALPLMKCRQQPVNLRVPASSGKERGDRRMMEALSGGSTVDLYPYKGAGRRQTAATA